MCEGILVVFLEKDIRDTFSLALKKSERGGSFALSNGGWYQFQLAFLIADNEYFL